LFQSEKEHFSKLSALVCWGIAEISMSEKREFNFRVVVFFNTF